jgi:hypothetical protein
MASSMRARRHRAARMVRVPKEKSPASGGERRVRVDPRVLPTIRALPPMLRVRVQVLLEELAAFTASRREARVHRLAIHDLNLVCRSTPQEVVLERVWPREFNPTASTLDWGLPLWRSRGVPEEARAEPAGDPVC